MSIFKNIWNLFTSRRFAAVLLITLLFLLLLGVLIPSTAYYEPEEIVVYPSDHPILYKVSELFNPPNLAASWTFITLNAMLALSTLFCTIERLKNREYRDRFMALPKLFKKRVHLKLDHLAKDRIESIVTDIYKKRFWKILKAREGGSLFIKGEKGYVYGFWGSIVFHIGFLIVITGVIVSATSRFNGSLLMTRGQGLTLGDPESYTQIVREARTGQRLPEGLITLDGFQAKTVSGYPVDYIADISITDQSKKIKDTVKVNKAVKHGRFNILLENYGYAPHLQVRSSDGLLVMNAYVNLKGREKGSADKFNLPSRDLTIDTSIFPDLSGDPLRSDNTYLILKEGEEERKLYLGETVSISGFDVTFLDLRNWAYFRITKDDGLLIIFIGFLFSSLGLVVRYIYYERRLVIEIRESEEGEGTEVVLSGHSRYFPALFENEVKSIQDQIVREDSLE